MDKLFNKFSANKQEKLLTITMGLDEKDATISEDVINNKNLNCENAVTAYKKASRFILNLAAVYYFEYTVLNGFGDRVANRGYIDSVDTKFQFEWFSLMYQIGVFFSRSSLFIVKRIKFVEIFTLIQIVNFFIWFANVYLGFISSATIAFINFVIVGLMGGASYVGCFYFLLNSDEIEDVSKELCINIASMFNDLGILLASICILIFNNTIMIDVKS
jgi:hypothetical protein